MAKRNPGGYWIVQYTQSGRTIYYAGLTGEPWTFRKDSARGYETRELAQYTANRVGAEVAHVEKNPRPDRQKQIAAAMRRRQRLGQAGPWGPFGSPAGMSEKYQQLWRAWQRAEKGYRTPGQRKRNPAEWAAQYITEAPSEASARHVLKGLALLDGYKGGRILPPTPQKPGWRVQTFHGDLGPGEHPEGMRRVLLTEGMARQLIRSGLRRNPRGRRKRNPTGYPFSGDPDEGGTYRPKLKRGGRPRRDLDEDMQAIGAEHISRHEHETGEQVEYPAPKPKKNPRRRRNPFWMRSGGRVLAGPFDTLGAAARDARDEWKQPTFKKRFPVSIVEAATFHDAKSAGTVVWTIGNRTPNPGLKRFSGRRFAAFGKAMERGELVPLSALPKGSRFVDGSGWAYSKWGDDAAQREDGRIEKTEGSMKVWPLGKRRRNPDEATRRFLEAEIAAGRKDPASRHIAGTAAASRPKAARGLLEVQEAGGARRAPGRRKAQQAALFTGAELGDAQRDLFGRKRNPAGRAQLLALSDRATTEILRIMKAANWKTGNLSGADVRKVARLERIEKAARVRAGMAALGRGSLYPGRKQRRRR